ncbi:hypothetical protein JM93_02942 [Roseibium hamelinense]|uniref:KANL3/Tex30 alpha/beta hydrolase-like domain-containing protein n=1 Tax=Roseibium hamelinense TaxID=150831 RepID=A0A562SVC7_9HYPH|nr:alpha/beta family hydrolase [Roseibium hamelinense]MTI42730.1 alpha/beta hydrolase [Roseibium hamelinense]TWI84610.1 hypothetical protein JM93_02942 [Roseibium hamelinense]
MSDFLWNRPEDQPLATLLLAHGAGAPMDSVFMEKIAAAAAEIGLLVARFEFAYMAGRRSGGSKRPPPKAENLVGEFQKALQSLLGETEHDVMIGGKSMGGRVAAMLAGADSLPKRVKGFCCLGYPFHPAGKPDAEWRLEPLANAKRPVLVLQGERDAFGSRAELDVISLPKPVQLSYIDDGSHDFGPRGKAPATLDGNISAAAARIAEFAKTL